MLRSTMCGMLTPLNDYFRVQSQNRNNLVFEIVDILLTFNKEK